MQKNKLIDPWNAEKLLSGYLELQERLGKVPSAADIDADDNLPSISRYYKEFGSLSNMRVKYNLSQSKKSGRKLITKEELTKRIAEFYKVNHRFPSKKELKQNKISRPSLLNRFNTTSLKNIWKELANDSYFKKEAGLSDDEIISAQDNSRKRWSNEQLVDGYIKLENKLGRIPTTNDIDADNDLPSSGSYFKAFGSLNKMRQQYDLAIPLHGRGILLTKDFLIQQVAEFYQSHNRFPHTTEFEENKISREALNNKFETTSTKLIWSKMWNEPLFIEQVKKGTNTRNLTNQDMLDRIKEYYRIFGETPRYEKFVGSRAIRRRFGTWNNAITEALGKDNLYKHNNYSRDELIKDYQRLSDELGHAASVNEIDDDKRMPAWPVYAREFESIIKLADEAHLSEEVIGRWQDNSLKSWTADQLLSGYRELEKKLGRIPTGDDINAADNLPSTNVYTRVFGSLTLMREKYNLQKPSRGGQQPIPKETLVRQVAEFYKVNNRFPIKSEFKPNGISRSALLSRFNTASLTTVWKEIVNEPTFKKIIKKR